jgi:hypothetical protein
VPAAERADFGTQVEGALGQRLGAFVVRLQQCDFRALLQHRRIIRHDQQRLVQGIGSARIVARCNRRGGGVAQILHLRIAQGLYGEFAVVRAF